MTDFKKLKVVELRAELATRSLPQTGKRDELIERLEEYEFQNAQPSHDEEMPEVPANTEQKHPAELVEIEEPQPSISPILPPTPIAEVQEINEIERLAAIEEEKRRQRALRFGIDQSETAEIKIEVALKRLDHALPNKRRQFNHHHRRSHHRNNKNHRQISINKP